MKLNIRHAAFALALLAGSAAVAAAQTLNLNEDQRLRVYRALIKEAVATPPPAGSVIAVGAELPASVQSYTMPVYVVDGVPAAGQYTFTVWNNQVVLVDRGTRKVVAVIRE